MLPIALFLPIQQDAAEALDAAAEGSSQPNWIFPILAILGIFYFVLILPERKKQKERKGLLDSVKKGDKVMTTSGMYGTVVQLHEEVMVLQIADGVRVRFSRAALQTVNPVEGGKAKKGSSDAGKTAIGKGSDEGTEKAAEQDSEKDTETAASGAGS